MTDWVLTSAVKELREALGDGAREPRIIETVHRRGYRFIAATRGESAIASGEPAAFPDDVVPGGAIVGRQAELDVLDGYWRRALAGGTSSSSSAKPASARRPSSTGSCSGPSIPRSP